MKTDNLPDEIVLRKIFELRGEYVIFDQDLAIMFGVDTKRLKEAVRRNMERFPPDFMFELSEEEFSNLRTQFASSSWGGIRYMPFAFTEQGIAMLSSVLKSAKAIEMNIAIIRTFVQLRRNAITYHEIVQKLKKIDRQFDDVHEAINYLLKEDKKLKTEMSRKTIGYK